MAAYAALVSLMNLMKDINNHPRFSTSLHTNQIESLGQSVRFLLDFVESYKCDGGSKEAVEDLERQIASAAHGAEDTIESHVVDQILDGSSQNSGGSLLDLQNEILAMNLVKENVFRFEEERMLNEKKEKVEEERGHKPKRPKYSTPSASSSTPLTNAMEGVADEFKQLMDALIGTQSSHRQIISIVGMGGIGKTTLAQNVYKDNAIVRHFDFRGWATISQEYNEREIILQLLSQRPKSTSHESFEKLGEKLYQNLFERRYLIVLDDMWSAQVWDKIKRFFPDNGNDSRVVVTTRLSNMEIPSCSSPIKMKLLDDLTSWKLFCQNALGQEDCPLELEELGITIMKKCKGLPLPIVVIGRHLRKSSRAKKYWESVANDMNSILDSEGDEQCLDILSLSYTHLPVHLKPSFLYMGFYQEDKEIFVPELIRCWIAEGFVKPNDAKNMEGVAYDHLKELTDRNLIVAHRQSRNGRIAHVKIHDLVREMCMKVGKKEKFFGVLDTPRDIQSERRVVFNEEIPEEEHQPEIIQALRSAPLLRTLKCEGGELPFAIKLLKVLNRFVVAANGGTLEDKFLQVNLRYVDYYVVHSTSDDESSPEADDEALCLSPSISLLWNLQTLIISGPPVTAPSEIWNMLQLRHLEFSEVCLPDPLPNEGGIVLLNLQTIRGVVNFKMSEEVCSIIPNIKELEIKYNDLPEECEEEEASSYYCPHNLGRFHKLESLEISFFGPEIKEWYNFARSLTFPNSLHQLSVINSPLCWEDMTMIGQIPHLEDLTMFCSAMGRHWDSVEGEFRSLKSLRIFSCGSLVCWIAENSHFPKLENLTIGDARSLVEIPSDIGEIHTLGSIHLQWCSISAAVSAARMLLNQEENFGNKDILLQVEFPDPADDESFWKLVGEEGFNCNNIRVLRY